MLRPRVIPTLLLNGRGLYKTKAFKNPIYVGDPINTVRIFNEKEVDEIVVLDINATVENREPPFEMIQEIASECFMPVAYGGGVRNLDQVRTIFKSGVEKIVLNTIAVEDISVVSEISRYTGTSSVVVAIDVKKKLFGGHEVAIRRGAKGTGLNPVEHARNVERAGAGEIFLNSVDRDGAMQGYDITLIREVSASVNIPVIASGGAGTLDHFHAALETGAAAVAAGSMFVFQGRHRAVLINYPTPAEIESLPLV